MNIIKGLITKDILQLKSYKRTLILYFIIFISSSIIQEDSSSIIGMLIPLLTLIFGMMSIATFSYDEMAKADNYLLTLPLTKKDIVKAKYILTISATVIGAILSLVISTLTLIIFKRPIPNIEEMLPLVLGAILGIGFVEAVQIPSIYKYGVEKGRIQIFGITIIIAFAIGIIVHIGEKISINMNGILDIISKFFPVFLILVIALIYFISYKISCRIYMKKK